MKATLQEIATALSGLTGEPHPLALPGNLPVLSLPGDALVGDYD
ncbi:MULTISPECIES: hypothetical protein [unclassified Actinoplanes]|nr:MULTISPECIES: hypothetical protein [unclassified Actinoplanes]